MVWSGVRKCSSKRKLTFPFVPSYTEAFFYFVLFVLTPIILNTQGGYVFDSWNMVFWIMHRYSFLIQVQASVIRTWEQLCKIMPKAYLVHHCVHTGGQPNGMPTRIPQAGHECSIAFLQAPPPLSNWHQRNTASGSEGNVYILSIMPGSSWYPYLPWSWPYEYPTLHLVLANAMVLTMVLTICKVKNYFIFKNPGQDLLPFSFIW